jgi:hypothetical protein
MPIHDWSRVEAGIFHAFHLAWIGQMQSAMNHGILPKGYYALAEQDAGDVQPDVLTLQRKKHSTEDSSAIDTSLMVAEAPPQVWQKESYEVTPYLAKQRTLAIHAANDDRIVAVIEIVSSGNKSGTIPFDRFVEKARNCFSHQVNLLIVDLHRPTKRDPQGIHGAIMDGFNDDGYIAPSDKKLTLVSYEAGIPLNAYIQPVAPGDLLPNMPLFIDRGRYVNVPLEQTYVTAFQSLPDHYQQLLSAN